MTITIGNKQTTLWVEAEAFPGVRKIAEKVAGDIAAVTGVCPPVVEKGSNGAILCATLGHSPAADALLAAGVLDAARLQGKREVFQICLTRVEGRDTLVICGSDKRGTIYGMFTLSEYLGVSPLCWWGDAAPRFRGEVTVGADIETVSKEPSVKYRGFFINDEWPCFGSWAESHFGDVNADCYDHIFEFLLRMKGNYLWPAMWKASFPLDGPGSANEELADLYGVVMGYSHHEPCLRASEEWDKVRGENSIYGNAWNYYTNEQGLLRYWEDALKRSGKYENIITIGMRGERDTSMLGENATLAENISLLKRIITRQREMIDRLVPRKATQMLALYKEVERYFHGDADAEGLRSWKELDDVLFMLCEDNFGHLRTVPPKELRDHPGGWGMYYHFDYHGGPISYEWVDSTPLAQAWEQMTQAWDYGIRDLWIVNVGDVKFHEVPLSYFLALAYDFDRWGSTNPASPWEYTTQWAARTFPAAPEAVQQEIARVFRDYIQMNSIRRPEALHPWVYHPAHYHETKRMLALAADIQQRSCAVYDALTGSDRDAYFSMVHYSVLASVNLVQMHLYAGINAHYAAQGKVAANRYHTLVQECIRRDTSLAEEFSAFLGGKWDGMQLAPHIGFTRWNEDDNRYPVLCTVVPVHKAAMKISRDDREDIATKVYGGPMVIPVEDFRYPGSNCVTLEVANGGDTPFDFTVQGTCPAWLRVEPACGTVTDMTLVTLHCDRALLPEEPETVRLEIVGDGTVAVDITGQAVHPERYPEGTHLPTSGIITIPAEEYSSKQDVPGAAYTRIADFGRYGSGMKVLPSTAEFTPEDVRPGMTYTFLAPVSGEYTVEVLTAPNNPLQIGSAVELMLETAQESTVLELLPTDFRAGENSDPRWCTGVLDQIHVASAPLHFDAGVQALTLSALTPGVVVERLRILAPGAKMLRSYLGSV